MRRVWKTVPLIALSLLLVTTVPAWAHWIQDGVAVCTASGNQNFPTIASDGAGGAIMTWYDQRGANYDIYAQRVNAAGTVQWAANGVVICGAAGNQYYPTITSDGAGGAIIAWYDQRSGSYDVYVQRVNASGAVQWTANGVALCTAAGYQWNPVLIPDGAGGAIVAWYDQRAGNYDIYAQRVSATGSALWTANGVALCTAAGDQYAPMVVPDGMGGAIVTWHDQRTGNWDIYAQRVNASGAVQWTANGVGLCTATGYQWNPTIVSDDLGGAVVTWMDNRSGAYDIYAQRVNASGGVEWAADGIPLCTAAGDQYSPTIASDGASGAIVVWHDDRGGNYDIYAQRVTAAGAAAWTADGVALSTATGTQWYPMIVSDGAGGAIVAWQDSRSGDFDIYARRVTAAGTAAWTADGVALSAATGTQANPTMTTDGSGGAIVTWQDQRSGNRDIYAQRVGSEGAMHTIHVEPSYTLTNCTASPAVSFRIDQAGMALGVRGYEVKFSIDPAVVTVTNPTANVHEGSFLSSVGMTMFSAMSTGGGNYTVSCAILGETEGAAGSGELFSVQLAPVAAGTSNITITSIKLRDPDNENLSAVGENGSVKFDCSYPTMEPVGEPGGAWHNMAPVFGNFGFDDDQNLDLAEYRIDAGIWTAIFSGIDAASWDGDGWTLPGFAALADGPHTVYFRVKDDAGNWNGEGGDEPDLYRWTFKKDATPPAAPTNFTARPGHNKTHLSWTNPTGDATLEGVEIRFNSWRDYPEYGTPGRPAPAYPADHTQGTLAAFVDAAAFDDSPRTPRDIYYYSAFTKDSAGNYSVFGTTAKGRATNYWLGDVDSNGAVNTSDLVIFSSSFGTSSGEAGWNAHCDFGPTDDWSAFGIPLPDNTIDFEDVMILSMNWEEVRAAGLGALAAARGEEDLRGLVELALVPGEDNTISVVLRNRSTTLKGLRFVVKTARNVVRVERGALIAGLSDVFFGTLPGGSGSADVCTAELGAGAPLLAASTGEIARLVLAPSEEPAVARFDAIDLRNLDNVHTELVVTGTGETPFVPKATSLMQNYPNPFNPQTAIGFDVASPGRVTIRVFDVSGRLVRTLADAPMAPGRHQVSWNGVDDIGGTVPSGIYFCRMKAPGYEATRKMILVR